MHISKPSICESLSWHGHTHLARKSLREPTKVQQHSFKACKLDKQPALTFGLASPREGDEHAKSKKLATKLKRRRLHLLVGSR